MDAVFLLPKLHAKVTAKKFWVDLNKVNRWAFRGKISSRFWFFSEAYSKPSQRSETEFYGSDS